MILFNNSHYKRLGNSMITYLYKKNYCGIALNMVEDPKAKFSLAINSGNLEVDFFFVELFKIIKNYRLLLKYVMN